MPNATICASSRVFLYYPNNELNPYQQLFAKGLEAHGFRFEPGNEYSDHELVTRRDEIAGVHLHWLENLVHGSSALGSLRSLSGLWRWVRTARRLRLKLIWTVHNHLPHDAPAGIVRRASRIVARAADAIIVHSEYSRRYVEERFETKGEILKMHHGNYDGSLGVDRSRAEIREELGLAQERPVVGLIGSVRRYRGHEWVIRASELLADDAVFLICGSSAKDSFVSRVGELASARPNVVWRPGRMSDAEYAEAIHACDVVLLPYREVTGSGALLAAWTLERPVVVSDLPFFREFVAGDSLAGQGVAGWSDEALAAAIRKLLAEPGRETFSAARREADRFAWSEVVAPVAEMLGRWQSEAAKGG